MPEASEATSPLRDPEEEALLGVLRVICWQFCTFFRIKKSTLLFH